MLQEISDKIQRIDLEISGLVQGVGFRPFIYRLSQGYNVKGHVLNNNEGVFIAAEATEQELQSFVDAIKLQAPPASVINNITTKSGKLEGFKEFSIIESSNTENTSKVTLISPDIAVCEECLADMKQQQHRMGYPFINCTNCGPRFSIIRDLPYDRPKTTMDVFPMCDTCSSEYTNIHDRRFHAQPVACSNCGPYYSLVQDNGDVIKDPDEVIRSAAGLITAGKIFAMKGIGGFFLACDAGNNMAVKRLRRLKNRDGKPFAVMFRDLHTLQKYCFTDEYEDAHLSSWRRPILILKVKKLLSGSVSNGLGTLGAMLPYMPVHYQLFEQMNVPAIVFTSGNLSDEPIIIDDNMALDKLSVVCDGIITYNREIYNRTDDSLMFVVNKKPRLMRRSRGYAPSPLAMDFDVDGIFATGAELKNTFCMGKNNLAITSQHIGDLKDVEVFDFYEEAVSRYEAMFRTRPRLIVHDMHPDYYSTKFAMNSGLPLIAVQHHHAHIASVLAEHSLDEKVIGVSFDGTGLGDDGNTWGSEIMLCDRAGYERLYHLDYMTMPGGDKAATEPWRMAVSCLYKAYGEDMYNLTLPLFTDISHQKVRWLIKAIDNKINCPLTSGAGRLFDAVAAITALCYYSDFEAEAPMRLEDSIEMGINDVYIYNVSEVISVDDMIRGIVDDRLKGVSTGVIAAKFHNTIISAIFDTVKLASERSGLNKVALSGGLFQNRYILGNLENKLAAGGFEVLSQMEVPCNDGGISLGQLAIASKLRELGCV